MDKFRSFLRSIPMADRGAFAKACDTSFRHLQNVAYGKKCSAELAIAIERESKREIVCEDLRPDVDWAAVRCIEKKQAA